MAALRLPGRLAAAALLALLLAPLAAPAAPRAEAWARWTVHAATATVTVDHGAWQDFLDRFLLQPADGPALFRYRAVGAADRARLDDYLRALQALPVDRLTRDQQRAYWINLYNAATVAVVLDHYPVASIRDIDISPGLFADGPWGAKLLAVEGEPVSLDDIEHRILRPLWRDPRVHYAVNCASLGCPALVPTAFTAANTERLLDEAAARYVASAHGVRLDGGRLRVSRIYDWFEEDFGGDEAGVIAHLSRHAGESLRRRLATVDGIDGYFYDWSLNDAPE